MLDAAQRVRKFAGEDCAPPMFAAPPEIEAEVFARLPERLHLANRRSKWAEKKGRPTPHSFLEGPAFDRNGNLFAVDIAHGRIFKISPSGEYAVFAEYDGEPNGLKIHRDGSIYVADNINGILRFDPKTAARTTVIDKPGKEPFKGPNDLAFASNGDMYFTDQGETGYQDPTGSVYCLRADGRLRHILGNVPSPNGLVLTQSQDTLYLAVTRDNSIWRVPMRDSGEAYKVGKFIQLSGSLGSGPDGLAMDEEDSLIVAHAGLASVWVFSRLGEPMCRIRSRVGTLTTNVAYGGPDRTTLYITESHSGCVLRARLPAPGRPLFSHL